MKFLIIGSSGFIGSHLVEHFLELGNEVICADIMPIQNNSNKFYLINNDTSDFSSLFIDHKFDYCINASGSASVPFSISNPAEDFRLNVSNVYLILHAIKNTNPDCKFVNFSSAAVYGNPTKLPITEDTKLSPISPYGFHKMISEQICFEFYKLYNIQTISLRVFSAFGPRLKKQLFWDLHTKLTNGNQKNLFGTGKESRDFIYIKDLCYAVDCVTKNSEFNGRAINIASGIETTISEAVKTFTLEYKTQETLLFNGDVKEGDPVNWKADITELIELGFKPKYSFELGIKELIKWLKNA